MATMINRKRTVKLPNLPTLNHVKSTPTTPVEPIASSPTSSVVVMRTFPSTKSSPVVVVPRQTADHCKPTSHVTTRPNSMI